MRVLGRYRTGLPTSRPPAPAQRWPHLGGGSEHVSKCASLASTTCAVPAVGCGQSELAAFSGCPAWGDRGHVAWRPRGCGSAAQQLGAHPPKAAFDIAKSPKGSPASRLWWLGTRAGVLVCARRWSWLHLRAPCPSQHRKVSISSTEKIWVIPGCDAVLIPSGTLGEGVFHM